MSAETELERQQAQLKLINKFRRKTAEVFSRADAREWLALAHQRWETNLPRFRRGDDSHDDALLRDGNAEVIQDIEAILDVIDNIPAEDESL